MAPRRQTLLTVIVVLLLTAAGPAAQPHQPDPLQIARILAARYPAQPIMSYIPALTWSSQLRLAAMQAEPQWRDKALRDMRPFISGETPAIAEPYRLTSLAAGLAFVDAPGGADLAKRIAAFIEDEAADPPIKFATGWTDDMFMAGAVWSRVSDGAYGDSLRRLLTSYGKKLQRPDGLFIHAGNAPHAWGRGNGFALLGVTEALSRFSAWAAYAEVMEIYRKHVAALAKHQSDDGSWRQVIDEPASYRELTATAMITAALARGIGNGWIDRKTYEPIMLRGWQAVAARVNADGTVRDVCSSTGAGPTREYYLNRPVVNGADDRGGAMALLAAMAVRELTFALH